MEVTQTKAEGLSRTFAVKVSASELQSKLDARIEEIRPTMNRSCPSGSLLICV